MRALPLVLALAFASALTLGCSSSSSSTDGSTDTGAVADTGTAADSMPMDSGTDTAADDAAVDDAAGAKPATPTITDVMKMSGALHVTWKLNDTGLANVIVMRKQDAGAYAKAYTLPGTATSQHDMGASTAGATYCYQVQTVKGGVTSDLSPEMCGSP